MAVGGQPMMAVLTETPLADMSLWSLALETIVLHLGTSRTSSQSLISKCEMMLILEFPLGSISSRSTTTRHVKEIRTLFWCATAVDPSGYVMEWGKCAAGCKADPAGTYLPAAPRRGNAGFTRARRGQSVGDFIKIIKAGNARNSIIH